MNVIVDEAVVRQHIEIISKHAVELAKSAGRAGVCSCAASALMTER